MAARLPPEGWDRDLPPLPLDPLRWEELMRDMGVSPQQARIVRLVHCDAENGEIARRLRISERVVRDYLDRIGRRLGVRKRSGLVLYAFRRSHELRD